MTTRNRKSRKGLLILLIIVVAILLALPLVARGIGGLLIVADPLKKADAAVALSGDKGERIQEAARLYEQDYVRSLYLTNVDAVTVRNMESDANDLGFPYKKIFVTDAVVSNTVEEAKAVRKLAESRQATSIIVITDPFHTLRTRIIFRDQFRGSGINVQVRPVRDHWYRSNTWWKTAEGRDYTWQEYVKIILYKFGIF